MNQQPQRQSRILAPNEYRCMLCGQVYEKGWSEEEAMAESRAIWGQIPQQNLAVICDECWQKIRPDKQGRSDG